MAASARVQALRAKIIQNRPSVSAWRAKVYTQSMKKSEGDPMILRHAKALGAVLEQVPVKIFQGELIVGTPVESVPGALIYPEGIGGRVIAELDSLRTRVPGAFTVNDEDLHILQDEVGAYWADRSMQAYSEKVTPKKVQDCLYGAAAAPFILSEIAGYGHISINYPKLLRMGFKKISTQAEGHVQEFDEGKIDDPQAADKIVFYKAAKIVADSIIAFAQRYAHLATKMAADEPDPVRKEELKLIAETCLLVPANPPRTFYQALQFIRFTHLVLVLETYDGQAISMGRIDQYLFPLYESDIKTGILDRKQARELVECLWIKIHDNIPVFDSMVNMFFGGLLNTQNVTIGGYNEAGEDATNELTHIMLDATRNVALPLPNVHVRVHQNAPPQFWRHLAEVIASGVNNVAVFNDDIVVKALIHKGIPLPEARNYATVGCVELAPFGTSMTSSDAALFNLGFCLELALNNGKSNSLGQSIGLRTGNPEDFKSMDDIIKAFRKQVAYFVQLMAAGCNAFEICNMALKPTPFLSLCVDDCFASGRDITQGSARYNFTGVQGVGMAEVADSLTAIDQVVFQQKKIDLSHFLQAVWKNYKDAEELRQTILNRVPKYGEDDAIADRYAQQVAQIYSEEVQRHRNARGGWFIPGMYSVTTHVPFGYVTSALPSGRLAGEPLSNGASPTSRVRLKGLTSALRSAAKIEWEHYANGIAYTATLDPALVARADGVQLLASVIQSYVELGGMQVQFNIVDDQTLRDAQAHPESFPQLIVRVAGYSAYFTGLIKDMQDEIIKRYERKM